MVKYKVVVTPQAQNSIRKITDRIKRTVSAQTANHVLKGITAAIKTLKTFPESHEIEHLISDEITQYRRVLKWNYRIIFVVDKEEIIVSVVDLVSSSQSEEAIKEKFEK